MLAQQSILAATATADTASKAKPALNFKIFDFILTPLVERLKGTFFQVSREASTPRREWRKYQ
jgi:hypothetical protein